MKMHRYLAACFGLIIVSGSYWMVNLQWSTVALMKTSAYELERGRHLMDWSLRTLSLQEKLHERNRRAVQTTQNTIHSAKLTSKLTEETIALSKEGLAELEKTQKIAQETLKELTKLYAYSQRLYELAVATQEASAPLEDFTRFSHELAKEGLQIARESLQIVKGEL